MNKNLRYGVLGWLLALSTLFSACSKEVAREPQINTESNGKTLVVQFPGRTLAQSGTLRAATVPAQDYEQALQANHIFFLVFEDNAGQPGKLKRIEPVTDLSAGVPEQGVTGKVFFRDAGIFHVVPTANLRLTKDDRDKLLGLTFGEVSKALITQPAGEPNWFPMAGEPVQLDTQNLATANLNFYLERLTARIDLVNETSTDKGGRFELTGARLREGDIDRSFLIKGQTPALQAGDPQYGAIALIHNTWIERDATKNPDPNNMWMQLYTYENVANELWIEVKGTFKGEPVEFMLPFKPEVKRNTLYRVAIRNTKTHDVPIVDPNQPDVVPAITALDWEEGGVATLEPTQDTAQPTITHFDASDAKGTTATPQHTATYGTTGEVNTIQSLTLSTPNSYTMKLTLHSAGAEPMVLVQRAEVPWIKVEPLGQAHISSDGLTQDYLVTFSANADLFPRTAQLEIQNRYYPDKITPRLIQVEQPKAESTLNQLAYWAKANVDELNTFAGIPTEDNITSPEVKGKMYQWGRNIAFNPHALDFEVVTTPSTGNDELLYDKTKFIYHTIHGNVWHSFPGDKTDTWSSIVAKATTAPASYRGTNGGDPSPVGYRLPYSTEFRAILSFDSNDEIVRFAGDVNAYNVSETVKLRGAEAVVLKTDYYSDEKNVLYAIKYKGGNDSLISAFRYEYRGHRGLKITSRVLGASGAVLGVKTIANEKFWKENAGSDVCRYFPFNSPYAISDAITRARIWLGHTIYWCEDAGGIDSGYYAGYSTGAPFTYSGDGRCFGFYLRPIKK